MGVGRRRSEGCVSVDSDQFQPFTLSLNHTTPSTSPSSLLSYSLSLHLPITCYPKGVIQADSLERNGLKREPEPLSVYLVCVCVCARHKVKYSLCGVCEAVCQEGMRGEEGEQMDSLSTPACIVSKPTLFLLSVLIFYLPLFSLLFPFSSLFILSSSSLHSLIFFHHSRPFFLLLPLFTLCCLVADGSVGQQQQESRSHSVSKRWGRGEGGCGKRRRWRKEVGVRHMESLVKGPPQRECVCVW